ncbi:hypothetical protein TCAL_16511 [Tigriopus californicus]|uniref:ZSWIM1/3 RNaseH-like domain-containing protein n=1 Tax=Tigriopus californicus TaxID=6832 RepID=A0A553NUU4_TIGCA|nr:hypothetical protein TCAL_16511 [Tigriopus californicus]
MPICFRMLQALYTAGIPKKTVLEQYCSFENYSNMNQKLITSMDLRNLEKLHVNNGIDLKKSDFENICDLMERPDFRGFSFTDLEHDPNTVPSTISDKLIPNATKSMIVYASEEMLSQFHKYPVTLFVDGTHGTNKSKYSLISFVVADTRGEGVPIMIVIAKTESKEVIIPALEILQHLAPEALSNVKALDDTSNSWQYFEKNYGPNGKVAKPHEWARCFLLGTVATNLIIERYHRTIKDHGLRRMKRMDQLCFDLVRVDRFYRRKEAELQYGIYGAHKPSKAQADFESCHPDNIEDYAVTTALEDRKQKAVEILMRWKEFVEQGPSSELRIVLDHIEKFNGEAPIKMKRNIFPHVDRKRKRERAPINMDQAGIANMEKDILPLQIEVIKAQINMTRIPISESVAGHRDKLLPNQLQFAVYLQ